MANKAQEQMLKVLSKAQEARSTTEGRISVPTWYNPKKTEDIPLWSYNEIETMRQEINRLRKLEGKSEVTWNDVARVEHMALGHSDYSSKFSLYCAELVYKSSETIQP